LYPVFFKRRFPLHLALASLLVGTTVFLPQLGFLESWPGYVLTPLYFGGFFYLVWQGELLRAWNKEQQAQRPARTLALRGLSMMWTGYLPFLIDILYAAIFKTAYSYAYLARSIGGLLALAGTISLGTGLVLDWRQFPNEVDRSALQALTKMKEAGFELDESRLWVGIDSAIGQLGYGQSYPAGDDYVILVSPASIYSRYAGGLDQTLVHEISHVYLWQKKHPSHLGETSKEAIRRSAKDYRKKWQVVIISSVMNYPSEVFAEDLTFKSLPEAKNDWGNAALQYFQRVSRSRRIASTYRGRGSWRNDWLVLRNCYYSALMERYQMPDPTEIVKKTNARLLSSLPSVASTVFDYFHQVFLGLNDDITAEDYGKTLEDYLSKFIKLAEGKDSE